MSKLKNIFKNNSNNSAAKAIENKQKYDLSGLDAKSLAETKADIAGEKWRKKAEESGEIKVETGGPKGLEPTRYGDWEKAGRCSDF